MSETPIVGIGASAGGVEDILRFLSLLPKQREYACVILLHSSGHKGLEEILDKEHEIIVVDTPVVPTAGIVYIPKPQCDMVYERRMLKSVPSHSIPTPSIDRFFLDIGYKLRDKSAGILFSGTGRDGVFGLQAIALNGGETFVKDPKTSRFGQLAQEAIEAGVVDHVMDIPEIVESIEKLWQEDEKEEIDLEPFYELFEKVIDLRPYKEEMLQNRIIRRMMTLDMGYEEYLTFLKESKEERFRLLDRILVQVTSFFRDHEAFEALEKLIRKRGKQELRIWDVGCSSGEEAYSLAIMLQELGIEGTVFASDISAAAIKRAREGCYSFAQIHKVKNYEKYFEQVGDLYCLKDDIRQKVVFFKQDLLSERLLAHIDLVVCRNVLIYLRPDTVRQVLKKFHSALAEDGLLFLGKGENLPQGCALFEEVDARNKIFRKIAKASAPDVAEEELQRSVLEIDALNEELEAMNEELRYSNEELQRSYRRIKELYDKEQQAKRELEKKIYQVEVLKEEIFAQREFYKAILDSLHAFVVLVEDERIKYINKAFLEFLGVEDVESLREFVHDDICSLFVPFLYRGFIDAKECRSQKEIDGAKVVIKKDGESYYFVLHKKRFGYATLYLLEDITPVFQKKLDLYTKFSQNYQKYALFQDILRQYRHIFLYDALSSFIEREIYRNFGAIYRKIAEIEEYCELDDGLTKEVREKKERVLELLEFLKLKDGTGLSSVSQLHFYCQRLREVVEKKYGDVEFLCELDIVHIDDNEGLFKDLLLLLIHLEILMNKRVDLRIREKNGKICIHASSLRYVKEMEKRLKREEEIGLKDDVAFLIYEILVDIYRANFDQERVVLKW